MNVPVSHAKKRHDSKWVALIVVLAGLVLESYALAQAQRPPEDRQSRFERRLQLAQDMFHRGARRPALAEMTEICAAGYGDACNRMGWIAEKEGEAKDAKRHYETACSLKSRKGCNNAGWLAHKEKRGTDARVLFARACELGHKTACQQKSLATTPPESPNVATTVPKAAGCDSVETCLAEGKRLRVLERWSMAEESFRRGCDQGSAESCFEYALTLQREGKIQSARKVLEDNCLKGSHAPSCFGAGDIPSEKGNALLLFSKACDEKIAQGCVRAGDVARDEGRMDQSKTFYARACDLGEGDGCDRKLAEAFAQSPTIQDALAEKRKACQAGQAGACLQLADTHLKRQDLAGAKPWLEFGCTAGEELACLTLENVKKTLRCKTGDTRQECAGTPAH